MIQTSDHVHITEMSIIHEVLSGGHDLVIHENEDPDWYIQHTMYFINVIDPLNPNCSLVNKT